MKITPTDKIYLWEHLKIQMKAYSTPGYPWKVSVLQVRNASLWYVWKIPFMALWKLGLITD
jgi:hypothetical protein